jgi:predicted transcriptional regulator
MKADHTDRDDWEAWKDNATRQALAQVEAGLVISAEAMKAWAASLGTDNPLPLPQPGQ